MLKKQEQGITLVALIITIIILVILAAVAITTAYETGIIQYATDGTRRYAESGVNENKIMNATVDYMSNALSEIYGILGETGVSKDSKVKAGEEVTKETQEKDNYTDIEGRKATIPEGFKVSIKASEQLIDDGLVVQDNDGNEFVWVPCTEEQYKMHDYTKLAEKESDGTSLADGTAHNQGWNTWCYRIYNDWKEDNAELNKASIKKYGGFYIARYEAGVTSNAPFYVSATSEKKTYMNGTQKNVSSYVPVSKKGIPAWNFIDQTNATKAAESMYSGSSSVKSQLVDGIAWDRIVNWIVDSGKYTNIEKDSTSKGNYRNNQGGIAVENTLWAEHVIQYDITSGTLVKKGLCLGKNYKYGQFKSGWEENWIGNTNEFNDVFEEEEGKTYQYSHFVEMATGTSDVTKLNNIYDLAGNMYEWTTEYGHHGNKEYATVRGGSFNKDGGVDPVSIRMGGNDIGFSAWDVGFRVVLYLNTTES